LLSEDTKQTGVINIDHVLSLLSSMLLRLCYQATTPMAFVTTPLLDMVQSTMPTLAAMVADAAAFFVPAILSPRWSGNPQRGRGQCASSGGGASIIMAALSQRIDIDPVTESSLLSLRMSMAASSSSA
jgi:hypothetical protein